MTTGRQEQIIRALCARRRLTLEPFGKGWRITGPGIYVCARRVSDFEEKDCFAVVERTPAPARR